MSGDAILLACAIVAPLALGRLTLGFFRGWVAGRDAVPATTLLAGNALVFLLLVTSLFLGFEIYFRFVHDTTDGDALTKGDDFAAGGLFQHLGERRVRVIMEPLADFLEFMAIYHPALIFGRKSRPATNLSYQLTMSTVRKGIYARLRKQLPWLPAPDTKALVERAHPIIGRETNGTASLAVGSALLISSRMPSSTRPTSAT